MEYISANEASENWGISPARVRLLAQQGRIVGASHMGGRWLIPTAAKKPADGRTRDNRTALSAPKHRFPLYLYTVSEGKGLPEACTGDERVLFDGQRLLMQCRFDEANEALSPLAKVKANTLVRAGALHGICLCEMTSGQAAEFAHNLRELDAIAAADEESRIMVEAVRADLRAYYKGADVLAEAFPIALVQNPPDEMVSFLMTAASWSASFEAFKGMTSGATSSLELGCVTLERQQLVLPAIETHVNLAIVHYFLGDEPSSRAHMDRAVVLSFETGYTFPIALRSHYLGAALDASLERVPDGFAERVREAGNKIHEGYRCVLRAEGRDSYYSLVSKSDVAIVALVAQGLANKEIATMIGVSPSSVGKRVARICRRFGLGSKKELVAYARGILRRDDDLPQKNSRPEWQR